MNLCIDRAPSPFIRYSYQAMYFFNNTGKGTYTKFLIFFRKLENIAGSSLQYHVRTVDFYCFM